MNKNWELGNAQHRESEWKPSKSSLVAFWDISLNYSISPSSQSLRTTSQVSQTFRIPQKNESIGIDSPSRNLKFPARIPRHQNALEQILISLFFHITKSTLYWWFVSWKVVLKCLLWDLPPPLSITWKVPSPLYHRRGGPDVRVHLHQKKKKKKTRKTRKSGGDISSRRTAFPKTAPRKVWNGKRDQIHDGVELLRNSPPNEVIVTFFVVRLVDDSKPGTTTQCWQYFGLYCRKEE